MDADFVDMTQRDNIDFEVFPVVTIESQPSSSGSNCSRAASTSRVNHKHNGRNNVGKQKTDLAEEKRAKKQKLQEEKMTRLADIEKNKIYKPGECMKYMTIEVHPILSSSWYMSDVSREAAAAGCRLAVENNLCDPALVLWTRNLQPTLTVNARQVELSTRERCSHALYVYEASALAELVHDQKLAEHMIRVGDIASCRLTLVVFGAKDYFKTSNRKTMNSNRKRMTEIELEMALTDLIVSAGCDAVIADTPNQLALFIMQYTKAIAEAPFKLAKRATDEKAEFYMRGDKKDTIALDEHGNGVERLWQQMIATLPNSSLEIARELCNKFKTPSVLYEALNQSDIINELASLPVSRAAAPHARKRRLGPEFARKLHTLFTAENGDMLIE